jgi:carbonic anhydrase
MPFTRPSTPEAALARLLEGNRRFVGETARYPLPSAERIELASGQQPYAVVIGCSDSRVPVETVFDEAPGTLFVARLAGNIVSDYCIASAEYAVTVLGSMLVLVLGHTQCGAVQAAIANVESGRRFEGHIQLLAEVLAPIAEATRGDADWWESAVEQNVLFGKQRLLRESAIVRAGVEAGTLRVAAALYDLHTGLVKLLD